MTNADIEKAQRIIYLLSTDRKAELTDAEHQELVRWANQSQTNRQLYDHVLNGGEVDTILSSWHYSETESALERVTARMDRLVGARLWYRIAAVASIFLMLGVGFLFYQRNRSFEVQTARLASDVAPGKNTATLTLSSGKIIQLSEAKAGIVAGDGIKYDDGTAVDGAQASGKSAEPGTDYMTIATPRGGKYNLKLADGSVLTLDAASSVTYPAVFMGRERRVEMTGQVYFQIKHNAAMPFKVMVQDQLIEDLGTEFNVNAYADEPVIKTTLLEGSARVIKGEQTALLNPGMQTLTRKGENKIWLAKVDTEEAVAWKNGYFLFNNEGLESVMRKVSRWYDVEIIYPSAARVDETYLGSISRYGNVSKVLQMLEVTGDVRFRVNGRKIFVLKKSNLKNN